MKFKYTGEDGRFCIELTAYELVPRGSYLKNGQIIDVPNDLTDVIGSLDVSGLFHRVEDKKVNKKSKEDK